LRRQILKGENIEEKILEMMSDVTSDILDNCAPEDVKPDQWNLPALVTSLKRQFGLTFSEDEFRQKTAGELNEAIGSRVKSIYDRQKHELGEFFHQLGRMLLLQTIDQRWKDHLEVIDQLKEGINLRAYAQKDPLIEYKKEAFSTFQEMNRFVREEMIEKLLKIKLVNQDGARRMLNERQELDAPPQRGGQPMAYSYGPGDGPDEGPKMNREQRRRMEKQAKKKKVKL
jgi:preprotein translocase subunit SecA